MIVPRTVALPFTISLVQFGQFISAFVLPGGRALAIRRKEPDIQLNGKRLGFI